MAVGATVCMCTVITNLHQQLTVINCVVDDKTALHKLVKEAPALYATGSFISVFLRVQLKCDGIREGK
jgi:hypothetical protein